MPHTSHSPVTPDTMPPFDGRYGEAIGFKRLPLTVQHAFSDLTPRDARALAAPSTASLFREVPQDSQHRIWQQVERAAEELGYPLPKHVYVIHTNAANAFGDSPTQTMAISQGAVEALDLDSLRVIIRHELRHLNQPELASLEPLEEKARRSYNAADLPRGTLLPYNWAHSVLMAIQRIEDEAIMAEADYGDQSDAAVRSLLQLMKWNVLLPRHTVGERCVIENNPYESLYEQLIRPQAAAFFEGETIALAQQATWHEFVEQADPLYLCAVVDTIDEVLETNALRPPGAWREDAMLSHPSHLERFSMLQQMNSKAERQ